MNQGGAVRAPQPPLLPNPSLEARGDCFYFC